MNSKQEQKICKVTSVIFVLDTLPKNVFSRLDLLVFSVYLNTIKKKQFFQLQILSKAKINPCKFTDI